MPLINGQKMACEPCIRGHRSTKCTHANERLMVPVRKPGRPLSSCPHPASRPCSCGAVTAAIPRKQKCSCGPSNAADAELKIEPDDATAMTTPPSDSKSGNPSYRVQKSTSKGHNSRKQSIGSSTLDRMDTNQLNILPTYDEIRASPPGVPTVSMPPVGGLTNFGGIVLPPAEAPFGVQPMMYPMFSQPMSPILTQGAANTNGHSTNGSVTPGAEKPARSCCGGNAAANGTGPGNRSPATVASETASEANRVATKKTKSCCAPAVESPDSQSGISVPPSHSSELPGQPNGTMMPGFQIPMAMPNGMYPFFQPTVFTYPPQYGSYMQPLLPEQWRQMMAALSFGQQVPVQGFDVAGTANASANTSFNPQNLHGTQQTAHGVSHHCTCGDGCNCVGCAAHPYNEATQNYVRSAWNSMMEDSEHSRRRSHRTNGANEINGINDHGHEHESHDTSTDSIPNGTEEKTSPQAEGTTTEPQTPSDVPSGFSEEQTLSASDFFFVSYPFGETCAGETSSCPCGDDCQCIGCAIHNHPEPAQTESRN